MQTDSDEDSELLSREDWDETVDAVGQAAQERSFKGYSRAEGSANDRRALGHLWLVSYSDFMTIMMIFFLGLYGYTVLAKAKLLQQKSTINYSEFAAMVGKLKGSLGSELDVEEGKARVTIRLSDRILFSSGRSELNENAIRSLAEIATSLKLVEGEIIVEGHTDNVPIRAGRFKTNWELSAARAFSVIQALHEHGVPQERMAAWGFGENRPLASNEDEAGRSKNRRIEILINKKGSAS